MFKNIFENKISEKLTTFNTSGKSAMEWMGKFTQQIDISEKIQQLNETPLLKNVSGVAAAANTFTQLNNNNNLNATNPQMENSLSSSSISNNSKTPNNNTANNNNPSNNNNNNNINNNSNNVNGNVKKELNSPTIDQKPNALNRNNNNNNNKTQNGDSEFINNENQSNNKSKSKQTTQQPQQEENIDYDQKLKQISEEIMNNQNKNNNNNNNNDSNKPTRNRRNSLSNSNNNNANSNDDNQDFYANARQLLTRQSTEMTSTFPFKAFHGKINSHTIEIPGLNVKVVRYKNMENDIGKIDPNLYRNYSNIKGGDSNGAQSKGKLYFSLRYNEEIQSFSVNIIKAELTMGGDRNSSSQSTTGSSLSLNKPSFLSSSMPSSPNLSKLDTYVKVTLLPDKKRKYQTKIQRKTSTPAFDETFYFATSLEDLQSRTLYLALYEFGRFLKHELIGAIRLSELHLIKDIAAQDVEFTRNLIHLAEDDLELGELTVTLCYLPAAGRLTVTIVKCDNLKSMDINGKSDPYVKVTLVSKGKRLKKKKTSVQKNNLNPVYNESMLFDLLQEHVDEVDMIIKVIDYDRVGQNELIGCIGIGPSFNGIGRDHWYRMLENPRKTVTQTYFLRDSSFLRENLPAKLVNAMSEDRQDNGSIESKTSAD